MHADRALGFNNKSYCPMIEMNMSRRNKGKENQMGSSIDEELERALKLSLSQHPSNTNLSLFEIEIF